MCVHNSAFGMTRQGYAHAFTQLQTLMPGEYSSMVTSVLPTHALRHADTHTNTHTEPIGALSQKPQEGIRGWQPRGQTQPVLL